MTLLFLDIILSGGNKRTLVKVMYEVEVDVVNWQLRKIKNQEFGFGGIDIIGGQHLQQLRQVD